ncbi:hypothetical protein EH223_07480 [candidate division KSB1 bacterium]|nr:hypothetical protein [candidate division KSB1 bacterium]RQW04386.1 MAG: hypothetical protein EH223_07480 [candidate division KSB1 bacterium]
MRIWISIFWLIFFVCFYSSFAQELESYKNCAECHVQNVADWKTSRHAQSTPATNPFYAAMRTWADQSTDGVASAQCDRCHVPVPSLATTTEVAERLAHEGVTCDVCHATQSDRNWLIVNPSGVKYGPYNDAISVVHESEYSEFLVSSRQCLTCHANLESAHGFAFCSTQKEYLASSYSKKGVTCQDCHMPSIEGKTAELGKIRQVYSHKFYGGYNPEILRNCASLELEVSGDTTQWTVNVTLTNRTVGHALPTGSPLRSVFLSLSALDVDGNVVWQNYKVNPLLEDSTAVFMRVLQDEKGQAPVPPWLATKIKFDQRLKPDETRELLYKIPGPGVVSVFATLNYRLAPPDLLKKLHLDFEPYSDVVTIATAQSNLK